MIIFGDLGVLLAQLFVLLSPDIQHLGRIISVRDITNLQKVPSQGIDSQSATMSVLAVDLSIHGSSTRGTKIVLVLY